jgi:hypothetical protein
VPLLKPLAFVLRPFALTLQHAEQRFTGAKIQGARDARRIAEFPREEIDQVILFEVPCQRLAEDYAVVYCALTFFRTSPTATQTALISGS